MRTLIERILMHPMPTPLVQPLLFGISRAVDVDLSSLTVCGRSAALRVDAALSFKGRHLWFCGWCSWHA